MKNTVFKISILVLYSILVLMGVYYHEPWRDEAHAWMISKNFSFPEVIYNAKFEATPILWYTILMPFSKTGFPYLTMNLIHGFLAIAVVGILLFFGNMSLITKTLFIFSYYMAYEYAIIARNYVLSILCLFSLAGLYRDRFKKPLIYALLVSLLSQTNTYSVALSAGLTILYCYEIFVQKLISKKIVFSAILMILYHILYIFMFKETSSISQIFNNSVDPSVEVIRFIRQSFIPTLVNFYPQMPWINFDMFCFFISACLFLIFFILLFKINKILFLYIITFFWICYMNIWAHSGSIRNHGLSLIFLMFFWWMHNNYKTENNLKNTASYIVTEFILNMILGISVIYTISIYPKEFYSQFSGSKDISNYIISHNLENAVIVPYYGMYAESVLPYLHNKRFWYAEYEKQGDFYLQDSRFLIPFVFKNIYSIEKTVQTNFNANTPILLLLSESLPRDLLSKYKLLHKSNAGYFWGINDVENFYLYGNSVVISQIKN
jgi:hypothetical protein